MCGLAVEKRLPTPFWLTQEECNDYYVTVTLQKPRRATELSKSDSHDPETHDPVDK
jgi:hypothetical protein